MSPSDLSTQEHEPLNALLIIITETLTLFLLLLLLHSFLFSRIKKTHVILYRCSLTGPCLISVPGGRVLNSDKGSDVLESEREY